MYPLVRNDLERIFEKLDKNGDGIVSLEEINWLLETIGLVQFSIEELESLVGKNSLNFNDFLFLYDSISSNKVIVDDDGDGDDNIEEDRVDEEDETCDLVKAFRVFDINGDGFISCDELQSMLSKLGLWDECSGKDCKTMICVYDTNSDGLIDFEEFKKMMLY